MNIFVFDNVTNSLKIDEYTILLVKEFKKLWNQKRNVCKEDKTGEKRIKAYKEFTYIYLTLDFKSPYYKYSDLEKHNAALLDSNLIEEDLKDPDFKEAYHKYDEIQNTDPILELIKTAYNTLRKTKIFLDSIDFTETDDDGRPLYKPKDVLADIGSIAKMRSQVQELEVSYKEGLLAGDKKIRGDIELGFQDE